MWPFSWGIWEGFEGTLKESFRRLKCALRQFEDIIKNIVFNTVWKTTIRIASDAP